LVDIDKAKFEVVLFKELETGILLSALSLKTVANFISKYLSKDLSYDDMVDKLNIAINQFSKRQMTFFRRIEKRGTVIHWIQNTNTDYIDDLINKYLKIE